MPGEPAAPGNRHGWYAVAVLILVYTLSSVDRSILTLLVKPIKASLNITDTQISLLHGFAFAIFYTLLGVPIGRMADRGHRVRLIAVGVALWSLTTGLAGMARNFTQLFIARVGVGVGEATLGPAAYSLLSDYFKGAILTRVLSLYTSAMYIGIGLASIIGGTLIASVPALELPIVGHLEPWQSVFLLVGFPGLLFALLMLSVREPARTGLARGALAGQSIPIREVVRFLIERRAAYGFLTSGLAAYAMLWSGVSAWMPTFFSRSFGWTSAVVGLRFGLLVLIFGTLGIVSGGALSGWLRRRGRVDANLRLCMLSALLAWPLGMLAPQIESQVLCMAVFALFVFAAAMPWGCAAAAIQEITPNQMRGQVTALYFLAVNMAGIGFGSTVVALITDRVFHNELALRHSLSVVAAIAAPLAIILLAFARRPYMRCRDATSALATSN